MGIENEKSGVNPNKSGHTLMLGFDESRSIHAAYLALVRQTAAKLEQAPVTLPSSRKTAVEIAERILQPGARLHIVGLNPSRISSQTGGEGRTI